MREKIDTLDWSVTPLGSRSSWIPTLSVPVELMLNSSQPMFIVWGAERILLYNDAMIPVLRDKHPFALGQGMQEVWPEAWSELQPLYDRTFAGEAISKIGFQVPVYDQGVIGTADFDFSYTPIRADLNSPVLGLFGVCSEMTSHLAARRQQLAMAQRESSRILEMSRDLFAVASFEGRLVSLNPAWSSQLGYTDGELLARPFAEIIHPDDLETTGNVVQTLMSGQPVHQFHVRLRKQDGSFIAYAWSAVPELDPPNGTFYTVGRDITEERAAQMELQAAQEALRQAHKLEAVGQLTGGLAHDFNNLLAGVSTSLQILRVRLATGKLEGAERYVQLGMNSVNRAAALTQRLLAFSRRQTLDPKPVNVNGLIHGFEDLIRRTIGPAIDLQIIPAADAWNIRVDALQLENSLLNLCINARDAMPDGGELKIGTSNQTVGRQEAQKLKLQAGNYVRICVDDTGNGMDAETKARAFDPFFTTKPIGQGTGLGLSMVYGFVQQSGGQVHIDTQIGQGTRLCLYLPRYLGEVESAEATRAPEETSLGRGEKIVVVEDEETIRSLLIEVLQEAGYEVMAAEDGAAGMRLLESSGSIDLLVTDVGLPGGMNGRQVADAARVLRPSLKVLFITGYADKAAIGDGNLPSGMEVMTKPFEVTTLTKKLRELLSRSNAID
jgi:PAS domain S-box-containing protein